jgi:hypothetical protein
MVILRHRLPGGGLLRALAVNANRRSHNFFSAASEASIAFRLTAGRDTPTVPAISGITRR